MEELLKQKEEIEKRIVELNGEIEMGQILDDQDMITTAKAEIEELNAKMKEIIALEEKMKLDAKKTLKKKAFEEKFPQQYLYERIMSMSDEELQKYASDQLSLNSNQKGTIEKEIEELNSRLAEVTDNLEKIDNRLSSIKEEFKETHAADLMVVAKELVAKQSELKAELEKIKEQIEKKEQELKEIGPEEMNPEEIRQGMLGQIEKSYIESTNDSLSSYISEQQEEGKTLEDIVSDINNITKKSKSRVFYTKILEKNTESLRDDSVLATSWCNKYLYDRVIELLQYYKTVINDISEDDKLLRSKCEAAIVELENMKEMMDPMVPLMIKYEEISTKAKADITSEDVIEHNEIQKELATKGDEIVLKLNRLRDLQCMMDTCIIYELADDLDDKDVLDPANKEKELMLLEKSSLAYNEYLIARRNRKSDDDPDFVEKDNAKDELYRHELDIRERNKKLVSHILLEEKKSDKTSGGKDMIEGLEMVTSSRPGQYTVEDIENYLALQDFLRETKEEAKKDSQIEKDNLTGKSEIDYSSVIGNAHPDFLDHDFQMKHLDIIAHWLVNGVPSAEDVRKITPEAWKALIEKYPLLPEFIDKESGNTKGIYGFMDGKFYISAKDETDGYNYIWYDDFEEALGKEKKSKEELSDMMDDLADDNQDINSDEFKK